MKDRTTGLLLLSLFFASLFYAGVLCWRAPVYLTWLRNTLFLSAHVLPAWILQMGLNRMRSFPKGLCLAPLGLLALTAGTGLVWVGCGIGGGWLVVSWTLAPAAGCLLALLVPARTWRPAAAGLALLTAAYLGLKHLAGMPAGEFWALDVPVIAILAAAVQICGGRNYRNRRKRRLAVS